jgi:hypothetical protein
MNLKLNFKITALTSYFSITASYLLKIWSCDRIILPVFSVVKQLLIIQLDVKEVPLEYHLKYRNQCLCPI